MVDRPKPGSVLVLLTVSCALPTLAQPQPDTLAFAQHMAPYRTPGRELTAPEVKSIQTEYLAWLNARVIAGRTIDLMNAELAAAELTDRENRKGGQSGYVAKIQPSPESVPPDALNLPADLMTVVLRIYTGKDCGADDTLVLYHRATRQRIGWLNAETDLAETLDGFIDEWLGIEDGEAIRFGSPATATQHRALRTRRSEEWYSFTDAAECPGNPPTHQVRAFWDKSKRTTYFRVSGDTAATLRMESVADSPIPGCRASRLDDIHQRIR